MIESNVHMITYGIIFVNNTKTIESLATKINQNIQFVDVNTWRVYEHYKINKEKIMLELGSFSNNFTYIAAIKSSFEERRSNFQGYQIKAMTGVYPPFIIIDYNTAILDIESQTYDVTTSVKGIDIDLLTDMQNYMNFSTTLHERQDKKWGPIIALDNGTMITKGIVESITSSFAEMIVSG